MPVNPNPEREVSYTTLNFLCTSQCFDQRNKWVKVKVDRRVNININVNEILKKQLKENNSIKELEINLSPESDLGYNYKLKSEKNLSERNIDLQDPSEWEVKQFDFNKRLLSIRVRKKRWRNIFSKLAKSWPARLPLIGLVVKYLMLPAIVTAKYLFQSKKENAAENLNELLSLRIPDSREQLRELFIQQKRTLEQLPGTPKNLLSKLDQAITNSQKIIQHTKDNTINRFSDEIIEQLNDRSEQGEEIPLKEIVLPTGYYDQENHFRSMIYTLTNDGEVQKLYRWDLGGREGESGGEQVWDITHVADKPRLLNELLTISNQVSELEKHETDQLSVFREATKLERLQSLDNQKSPQKELSLKKDGREKEIVTPLKHAENFLEEQGAIRENLGIRVRVKDSLDLMRTFLFSDDNHSLSDLQKIEFSIDRVNEEIELLVLAIHHFSEDEKQVAIKDLEQRIIQLEGRMKKVFGGEVDSDGEKLLLSFKERFDSIKNQEKIVTSKKKEAPSSLLSSEEVQKIQSLTSTKRVMKSSSFIDVIDQNYSKLKALTDSFETRNNVEALKTYEELSNQVDELVSKGNYSEALKLSEALQSRLPTPTSKFLELKGKEVSEAQKFWDQFKYDADRGVTTWNDLNRWGDLIDKVTKCQWEASLRVHRKHIQPNEMLGLMNGRAILVKLARMKSLYVKAKYNNDPSLFIPEGLNKSQAKEFLDKGLTYDEAAALVYDNYQTDFRQFKDILHFHPHYRLAAYPGMKKKTDQILEYLEFQGPDGGRVLGNCKIIRLDATIDTPDCKSSDESPEGQDTYLFYSDMLYREKLNVLSGAYNKKKNHYNDNCDLITDKPTSNNRIKPLEVHYLQRHTAMFQMLFRPEFSMALNFGEGRLAGLEAVSWFNGVKKKATKEFPDDPDKITDRAAEIAYDELADKIDSSSMRGRLDLDFGSNLLTQTKSLTIKSSKGSDKIYYFPFGLGFTEEFKVSFSPSPNDFNAEDLGGPLIKEWQNSLVGANDFSVVHQTGTKISNVEKLEIKPESQTLQNRKELTEISLLKLCKQLESKLGVMDEYQIRSLIENRSKRSANEFSKQLSLDPGTSGIENVLNLIANSPHLLSSTTTVGGYEVGLQVRHLCDLILTQPSCLKTVLQSHSSGAAEFGKRMKEIIERGLQDGDPQLATFVMHVGEMIRQEAENLENQSDKDEILEVMPGYTTEFFVDAERKAKKIGIDALKDTFPAKGIVKIAEIENLMLKNPNVDEMLNTLASQPQKALEILKLRSDLDLLTETEGTPMLNQMMLYWMDSKLLPKLGLKLQSDQNFRREMIQQIAPNSSGIELPEGNWRGREESNYLFFNGDYEVNIKEISIRKKGKILTQGKTESQIPKILFSKFSNLSQLIDPKALVSRENGDSPGSIIYSFQSEGSSYRIIYNKSSESASLYKDHYLYVKPESEGEGISAHAREYGLWIDTKNPNNGKIELPNQMTLDLTFDKKGRVRDLKVSGRNARAIDKDLLYSITKAVNPNHVIHLPGDKEKNEQVIFIDKGIVLEKISGHWTLLEGGKATGFTLSKREEQEKGALHLSIKDEFGIELMNQVTGEKKLLLWPQPILKKYSETAQSLSQERLSDAVDEPIVEVSVSKDHVVKASSASYLYLAYTLMKNKEYERAQDLLNKARQSRLETEGDKKLFNRVAEVLRSENPQTGRALAFQLQVEMDLLEIEEQQLELTPYDPKEKDEYLSKVQRLSSLYSKYIERIKTKERIGHRVIGTLKPSDEIEARYSQFRREALSYLLTMKSESINKEKVFKLSKDDIPDELLAMIATLTVDPGKKEMDLEKLKEPGELTSRYVLSHFLHYYNAIIEGKLKIDDLSCLFRQLEGERIEKLNRGQQKLFEMADIARNYLLFLASGKSQDAGISGPLNSRRADLIEFFKARKKDPKKPAGKGKIAGIKALLGMPKSKAVIQKLPDLAGCMLILKVRFSGLDLITRGGLVNSSQLGQIASTPPGKIDVKQALDQIDDIARELSLSDLEKVSMRTVLKGLKDQNVKETDINGLLEKMEMGMDISPIEIRREQELRVQTRTLERTLIHQSKEENRSVYSSSSLDQELVSFKFYTDNFFEKNPDLDHKNVETISARLEKQFSEMEDHFTLAPQKEEARQLREGVTQVVEKRITREVKYEGALKDGALPEIETALRQRYNLAKEQYGALEKECIELAINSKIPLISKMVKNPLIYSNNDLLNALLDEYQMGNSQITDEQEKLITSLLLWGTTKQQAENGLKLHQTICSVEEKLKNNQENLNLREEFNENSRKLYELMDLNLNTSRYLENGRLTSPELHRKFLVSEFRMGIILREGQREVVKELSNNPEQWMSLRMGEGKTFYIMPVVAALLVEKGYLPVMLVPEQLQSLNQADFDRTTLQVFGNRAHPFRVELDKTNSSAYLAGQYNSMLQVRRKKGYLVTSVQTLASIRSLAVQLREERSKMIDQIEKNKGGDKETLKQILIKKNEIVARLHWTRKIEQLLDGKIEVLEPGQTTKSIHELKTHLFGDEVDSTLHTSKEINRGIEAPVSINKNVRNLVSVIFDQIFSASSDSNEKLKQLKESFLDGSQANIGAEKFKKNYLPELTKALLKNNKIKEFLNPVGAKDLSKVLEDPSFISYITGKSESLPEGVEWDPSAEKETPISNQQVNIAALKHLLSVTFSSLFSSESGMQFKLDEESGALAVPSELGMESVGNRFGDEYEIVCFQYLSHIQVTETKARSGKTFDFYMNALKKLQAVDSDRYQQIKNRIAPDQTPKHEDLAKELINNKLLWKERLEINELIVFEGEMITRIPKQINVPAQSVVSYRSKGGVTGTLDLYGLPGFDPTKTSTQSTRLVEAETYIKTVRKAVNNIDQEVTPLDDTNNENLKHNFNEMLGSDDTVAIINEGGYGIKGKSVTAWVKELRELENGTRKDLVWFEEDENKRTVINIWEKDQPEPRQILNSELKSRVEPFIGLYAPQFTRGADLPLAVGNVHYLPSRTPNQKKFGQSIWRARGTGSRHTPILHAPKSVMGDKSWSYGDLFKWVIERGQSEQLPLNLMAQQFRVSEIATGRVRSFMNSFNDLELDENYTKIEEENTALASIVEKADDKLNSLLKGYFIKDKLIDFKSDFEPTVMKNTIDHLEEQYRKEIIKLEDIALEKLPVVALELINSFSLSETDRKMLSLFNTKESFRNLFNSYMKEGEAALSVIPQQFRSGIIRLAEARKIIGSADSEGSILWELEQDLKQLRASKEIHEKYLPQITESATSASGKQEQVQQQQQQQQMVVRASFQRKQDKLDDLEKRAFKSWDFNQINQPGDNSGSFTPACLDWGVDKIYLTKESEEILKTLPSLRGDPIWKFSVNQRGEVILLSKIDYRTVVEPGSVEKHPAVSTYLTSGKEMICWNGEDRLKDDSDIALRMAILKLRIGSRQFTTQEKKLLSDWYYNLEANDRENVSSWALKEGYRLGDIFSEDSVIG